MGLIRRYAHQVSLALCSAALVALACGQTESDVEGGGASGGSAGTAGAPVAGGSTSGGSTSGGSGGASGGAAGSGEADSGAGAGGLDSGAGGADGGGGAAATCASFAGVPDFWNGPAREIEFVAFGDSQFAVGGGCDAAKKWNADQNDEMIASINAIETAKWPNVLTKPNGTPFHRKGENFRKIRGVILAGDVTQNGSEPLPLTPALKCPEWPAFLSAYGLCGEAKLAYPVFEGYGNHDFPFRDTFDDHHPVVGLIEARNAKRPHVIDRTQGKHPRGHYAWKWDDIHFVNLNVKPSGQGNDLWLEDIDLTKPSDDPEEIKGKRRIDPHRALDFLDGHLAKHPPKRQVVLISHYGPSNQSRLSTAELTALCGVIVKHQARLIAWIHGHTHRSDYYAWSCGGAKVHVFNVGAPFYDETDPASQLHFAVFRIGNQNIEAVDVSASPVSPKQHLIPGNTTPNAKSEHNPDGLWGGWAVRAPIDPP